jgi:peptide deformylase
MVLPITTVGDPVLRQKGQEIVDFADTSLQRLIDDMIPTMYTRDGVGLAAPQVGESLQLAVVIPDPEEFEQYARTAQEALIILNPRIVKHSWFQNKFEEGCLSVPDVYGIVKRWNNVTVEFQDRYGTKKQISASGLMARILQHEIDHLNGILFIDKAEKTYKIQPL